MSARRQESAQKNDTVSEPSALFIAAELAPIFDMKGEPINTGDKAADGMLRFIAAHCIHRNNQLGDDYRRGVLSMYFSFAYLCYQSSMDMADVLSAIDYLVDNGFIRTDTCGTHGLQIWVRREIKAS